ncbi:nuclease-related domain-containing protein [Gaetbulibacter sp. M240]|uniref:nuclease-related domain-containing protein n=1 Tax=Gaetbulibacter sp. M240 TaxID=3126511 RepID=UPI00374E4AA7
MARIIGQIESLKRLRHELNKRNITRFSSIGDMNRFCDEFSNEKKKVLEFHEKALREEIKYKTERVRNNEKRIEFIRKDETEKLENNIEIYKKSKEILELKKSSASLLVKLILFFKTRKLNKKILYLTKNRDLIINNSLKSINEEIQRDSISLSYLSKNKQNVILNRSRVEIDELEYKKNTIDELRPLIAGAIGENMVEKEISKLSDDYTLINDFNLKFSSPIYNKRTNDRIYSIQIDHLLISRAGLFILETKNWSKQSINKLDLRSPVEQINRTNFALYFIANNINLDSHHWGKKQIPIRNIIVMINAKPKVKFKYVKVKLLKELNNYLEFFEPIFTNSEVDNIVNSLIKK